MAESDSLLMSCLGKPGPRVQIPASPPAKTMPERHERSGKVGVAQQAFVAQRIEHLTTDQKVGGSNPSERAR